jgi:hypothetical protein
MFTRSSDSNRFYWLLIDLMVKTLNDAGELIEGREYCKDDVHNMLKVKFLLDHPDTEFGKDGLPKSSVLNQRAYSEYLTECMAWAQTYLQIEINDAKEIALKGKSNFKE